MVWRLSSVEASKKSSWFLRCVAATCVLFMVDTDCVRVLLAASSCGYAICSFCFYIFNHCSDLLVYACIGFSQASQAIGAVTIHGIVVA